MATRAEERHKRLNQINKAYEKSHYNFHRDYEKAHKDVLRDFGIKAGTPFHELPLEVHEALAQHKHDLVGNLTLANEAKLSTVATLPRIKIIHH